MNTALDKLRDGLEQEKAMLERWKSYRAVCDTERQQPTMIAHIASWITFGLLKPCRECGRLVWPGTASLMSSKANIHAACHQRVVERMSLLGPEAELRIATLVDDFTSRFGRPF